MSGCNTQKMTERTGNSASPSNVLNPWSTRAINLPQHADNPVHTDAGAIAAGFERALVAGTTVYAYLTHPPADAWGQAWLTEGGGELRLRQPVFDDDLVECAIVEGESGQVVEAQVDGSTRATFAVEQRADPLPHRAGEQLPPLELEFATAHIDYGVTAGDDLGLYATNGIIPPVTWAMLANDVFLRDLVTGPWVHVRSKIAHRGIAHVGEQCRVESTVVNRFDSRAGERALVDLSIFADDRLVASVEHEAIMVLA